MTQFRIAVVLCFAALAACGDDGDPGSQGSNVGSDEDGGVDQDRDGGPVVVHGDAGHGGSTASHGEAGKGGDHGAAGATAPAAGSGGNKQPAAGSGDQAGRAAPAAGRGAGGRPSAADCPASAPDNGGACDGLTGLSCDYGEMSCRCRHTEPVWLCEDKAGAAGGGGRPGRGPGAAAGAGGRTARGDAGAGGAGGRPGRGNAGDAGSGGNGRGRGRS